MRVGVMGCAEIARRRILPAMKAHPLIELAAVASRDAAKAAETARQFDCRPVVGYEALLADDTVRAVYVPLPAALHAPWVEAALAAGKHVLAEKPLTTDPARTRELLDTARARAVVLMENVMFVHHAQHATVSRLVAEGEIGELRSLHATFTIPALPDDDIRHQPELGGGSLYDVGVYPVRAAVHFLRGKLEVRGAVLEHTPGRRVDTAGAALLRARDGVTAHLAFGMEHAYQSRYELSGSSGRILVDRAFTPPADHPPRILIESRAGTRSYPLPPDDQVANTLTAFVSAVRTGSCASADCLAQADLLAGIRRAAGLDR
ncbi:Gfo/Idh/MocA family oxidoreductase [Streptomyces sp. RB6PN23]|uniref:Gfo/Idh/MocA family oxidoreductase n=1 Tax=Streptomyces silvisoli TaxID=3034235 RepID=A0ABT5ZUV0_9ACTN|nr:Gfo/Idh/MocA family oxidoreductase [Streptomyces silvisoli]MDF3293380.1 Gfo/Idh/MocA family oxidoreductase [Streptomyces silvisoli]